MNLLYRNFYNRSLVLIDR